MSGTGALIKLQTHMAIFVNILCRKSNKNKSNVYTLFHANQKYTKRLTRPNKSVKLVTRFFVTISCDCKFYDSLKCENDNSKDENWTEKN